jgi:hypothetical protein
VAQRQLRATLSEFSQNLQDCKRLSADAYQWSLPGAHGAHPYISRKRRDHITELAFLHAFQSWEVFMEKSFILYLWGRKPPRGRPPKRYAYPPDFRTAAQWVIPEGRDYAQWTHAQDVRERAERFFKDGRPFSPVLSGNQNLLEEARKIRNAIAHRSTSARVKFEKLARAKLGALPPNLTVGGFLGMTAPGTAPPASFLESYIDKIDLAARLIIPS